MEIERQVLEEFLRFPLSSTKAVLEKFATLENAQSAFNGKNVNYVYLPGTRKDRVLLVAHCDTVWDVDYWRNERTQTLRLDKNDCYRGTNFGCGIGADDRAGCAVVYLLRNSGHSLLVLDGEEYGSISAQYVRKNLPDLFREWNDHSYMIQLDLRNATEYKYYSLPVSQEFVRFIEDETGYTYAGEKSGTDIVTLCQSVCGVNLSVGYYNEHTDKEYLRYADWLHTYRIVEKLLQKPQKRYPLLPATTEVV